MLWELDHLFCFVKPGFADRSELEECGFNLEYSRQHKGQGTANRIAFFRQHYLEYIWLESKEEAEKNPLRLDKRAEWAETGASPLGLGLRGEIREEVKRDFTAYHPPYDPKSTIWIHRFNEDRPGLPFLFVVEGNAEPETDPRFKEFINHPNGTRAIDHVEIFGPGYTALASLIPEAHVHFHEADTVSARIFFHEELPDFRLGDPPITYAGLSSE